MKKGEFLWGDATTPVQKIANVFDPPTHTERSAWYFADLLRFLHLILPGFGEKWGKWHQNTWRHL